MKSIKKTIQAAVIGIASVTTLGCGSSGSSNDQGASFTVYNFYSDSACTTASNGSVGPISLDTESGGTTAAGTAAPVYAALQNNLLGQTLRVRRVFYKFFIEGASTQPPPTTAPAGIFLASAGPAPGSSLPGSLDGTTDPVGGTTAPDISNVGCLGVQSIPTDILSYVSLNRNNLPELPFTMRVEVTFRGITSGANEIDSNPLDYLVQFTQDNIITPTSPTEGSSSSAAVTDTGESTDTTDSSVTGGSGQL